VVAMGAGFDQIAQTFTDGRRLPEVVFGHPGGENVGVIPGPLEDTRRPKGSAIDVNLRREGCRKRPDHRAIVGGYGAVTVRTP